MPYITTERVKEIRNEIKKAFPKFKFSITRQHHSSVSVAILSAPVELITTEGNNRRYEQVNEFHIKEHYEDTPKVRDILLKIYEIMDRGNGVFVEDSDYGTVPDFYTHLSIGRWDKPFTITN